MAPLNIRVDAANGNSGEPPAPPHGDQRERMQWAGVGDLEKAG